MGVQPSVTPQDACAQGTPDVLPTEAPVPRDGLTQPPRWRALLEGLEV